MPVKIRLMRVGARKRPFYRVVAVDERKKRTGGYIELLGTYNPLTQPKEVILKQDLIDAWLKKGAVMSDGYLRIIGKAPQRLPRKPKKEKSAAAPAAPAQQPPKEEADVPEDETQTEKDVEAAEPQPDQAGAVGVLTETPAEPEQLKEEEIPAEEKPEEAEPTPETGE